MHAVNFSGIFLLFFLVYFLCFAQVFYGHFSTPQLSDNLLISLAFFAALILIDFVFISSTFCHCVMEFSLN